MREFSVAIVLSALVLGGALLLPYSARPSLPVHTVAVQKQVETPKAPEPSSAEPARPATCKRRKSVTDAGDVEQGRQVYRKCQVCHSLERERTDSDPSLAGIIGQKGRERSELRLFGSAGASGLTWDAATLDRYLLDPQKLVPGKQDAVSRHEDRERAPRRDRLSRGSAAPRRLRPQPRPQPATPAPPRELGRVTFRTFATRLRSGIAEGRMVFIGVGGDDRRPGQPGAVRRRRPGRADHPHQRRRRRARHRLPRPGREVAAHHRRAAPAPRSPSAPTRAGDFTYICSVPGHELAGMEGQFLVTPRPPAQTVVEADISRKRPTCRRRSATARRKRCASI